MRFAFADQAYPQTIPSNIDPERRRIRFDADELRRLSLPDAVPAAAVSAAALPGRARPCRIRKAFSIELDAVQFSMAVCGRYRWVGRMRWAAPGSDNGWLSRHFRI